jgi:hypothetical protein
MQQRSGRVLTTSLNVNVGVLEVGDAAFLQEEDVHLMGSRPDDVQGRDGSPASNGLGLRQL